MENIDIRTPIDEAIQRQQSATERPKNEKAIEKLITGSIDKTWTDPKMIVLELTKLGLSKSEICKKLNIRFRILERWLNG